MQSTTFSNVKGFLICLLVLLVFCDIVVTSQRKEVFMNTLNDKRFDVAPRDVITRSSSTRCAATCRDTSWCVSMNLFTGDGTCQLLSEVESNETSLEAVDGWRYLRKFDKVGNVFYHCHSCSPYHVYRYVAEFLFVFSLDVDDCWDVELYCENGGQAVDTGRSCECQCAAGYTGEHCRTGQKTMTKLFGCTYVKDKVNFLSVSFRL